MEEQRDYYLQTEFTPCAVCKKTVPSFNGVCDLCLGEIEELKAENEILREQNLALNKSIEQEME